MWAPDAYESAYFRHGISFNRFKGCELCSVRAYFHSALTVARRLGAVITGGGDHHGGHWAAVTWENSKRLWPIRSQRRILVTRLIVTTLGIVGVYLFVYTLMNMVLGVIISLRRRGIIGITLTIW